MPTPDALRADLVEIGHALKKGGGGALASGGAVGRLIRAVETFGFHLATLDLRQNADVHERVVAELLDGRRRRGRLSARSTRPARVALLRARAGQRRGCSPIPYADYSDETALRAGDRPRRGRGACAATARHAITTYIISKAESVSDLLEVHILLKEAGLYPPGRRSAARAAIMVGAAVRDDRRSRERARR